jgi:Uma2 family endonuclease
LIRHLPEEQYDILPGELGFVLSVEPKPTVRGADLAVMYHEEEPKPGFVEDPPLLVIEVVSPSNDPQDLEKKRIQYLAAGAQEVWIVYDKTQTIHVFQNPEARSFVCDRHGTFTSNLGFPVVASDLFR